MRNGLGLARRKRTSSWFSSSSLLADGVNPAIAMDGNKFALPAYGPELVSNGTFDTDLTGWTDASTAPSVMAWSGGQAVTSTNGVASSRFRQEIQTTAGKLYQISFTGTNQIFVGATEGTSTILGSATAGTRYFTAVSSSTWLGTLTPTNGLTLDNVSVREVMLGELGTNLGASGYTLKTPAVGTETMTESPSGTLNLTGDAVNSAWADKQFTGLTVGAHYRCIFLVATNTCTFFVGTTQGDLNTVPTTTLTVGVAVLEFTATATTHWVRFFRQAVGTSVVSSITIAQWTPRPTLRTASFNEVFAYTASSTTARTYVGSDGLIKNDLAADQPRWDFSSGRPRLLLENQSTNLFTHSQNFDTATSGSTWNKGTMSVTADSGASPTGTIDADLLVEAGAGIMRNNAAITVVTATTYTVSAYVKRSNCDWIRSIIADSTGYTNGVEIWFNLATGAVGTYQTRGTGWTTAGTPTITPAPNGFYRIAFSFVTSGTALFWAINTASANASGTRADVGSGTGIGSEYFLWGAQLEAASFASSYIPTTSATVTRLIETARFSPLVEAILGPACPGDTLRVTASLLSPDTAARRVAGNSGAGDATYISTDSNNVLAANWNGSVNLQATAGSGGWRQGSGSTLAWNSSGRSIAINGGAIATDTSLTVSTAPSYLARNGTVGTQYADGFYDSFAVWPFRATDSSVAGLSTPWEPVDSDWWDDPSYRGDGNLPAVIQDGQRFALPAYGPELVSNGTFDTDTAWTKGTGATISGGVLNLNIGAFVITSQSITLQPGKLYEMSVVVARTSGLIQFEFNSRPVIEAVSSSGTFRGYFTPVVDISLLRIIEPVGGTFVGTVDNVSVREVMLGELGPNLGASGYTMSVNGGTGTATESPTGQLNLTGDGTNRAQADKQLTGLTVGAHYRIVCLLATNAANIRVGTTQGGTQNVPETIISTGVVHFEFTATATTHWVSFLKTGATLSTISSITIAQWTPRPTLRTASFNEVFAYTASSTTARTYVGSDGLRKNDLAADQPRWDFSNGKAMLLLENASTNLALHSQDFSNAVWSLNGDATKVGASSEIDPAGGTNAYRVNVGTTGGTITSASAVFQSINITNATPYTYSVYIRSVSGTSAFRLSLTAPTGNTTGTSDLTATTTWQRFTISGTGTSTALGNIAIRAATAGGAVGDILVWGAQLEAQAFASSYIPTAGSTVTRLIETARFSPLVEAIFQQSGATARVQGTLVSTAANARVIGGGASAGLMRRGASDTLIQTHDGSTSAGATLGSGAFVTGFGGVIAFNSSGRAVSGNGSAAGSDTTAIGSRATVYLARDAAVAQYGDGYYNSFALWPFRASNANLPNLARPKP